MAYMAAKSSSEELKLAALCSGATAFVAWTVNNACAPPPVLHLLRRPSLTAFSSPTARLPRRRHHLHQGQPPGQVGPRLLGLLPRHLHLRPRRRKVSEPPLESGFRGSAWGCPISGDWWRTACGWRGPPAERNAADDASAGRPMDCVLRAMISSASSCPNSSRLKTPLACRHPCLLFDTSARAFGLGRGSPRPSASSPPRTNHHLHHPPSAPRTHRGPL